MSEEAKVSKGTGRRPRPRGGLGRGLGALIPTAEDELAQASSRPLDVLFPDLVGSNSGTVATEHKERGGSARDLLVPGGKTSNVSRETIRGARRNRASGQTIEVPQEDRSAASSNPTSRFPGVEMELTSDVLEGTGTGAGPDGDGRAGLATESAEGIVSRETIHPEDAASDETGVGDEVLEDVPGATYGMLNPQWIIPNLKQPRQVFDDVELEELSNSIAEVGILQPIVVRRITEETLREEGQAERLKEELEANPEARYELVMGERRWRAAQRAGLSEVPAIVRTTDEDELLREALIENMHRVQLNPLEEAAAYNQLMEDFSYTQEQLAQRIARSRPQIANTLRLLTLPPSVQRQVAARVISAGHARALLGLNTSEEMEAMAARVVAEGLSVRATEELVKFGKRPKERSVRAPRLVPPEAQRVADAVAGVLDTSVTVSAGAKKGRLIIEYADQNDLDRIAEVLGVFELD